jgi:hypothetical protein
MTTLRLSITDTATAFLSGKQAFVEERNKWEAYALDDGRWVVRQRFDTAYEGVTPDLTHYLFDGRDDARDFVAEQMLQSFLAGVLHTLKIVVEDV